MGACACCWCFQVDPTFLVTPAARGWGGCWDMAWVEGRDFERMKAVRLMGEMETGTHVGDPSFKVMRGC